MNNNTEVSNGMGLLGWTFIVLLVMKLAEIGIVANWSWWWVTAPLWGLPIILFIGLSTIWIIAFFIDLFRK